MVVAPLLLAVVSCAQLRAHVPSVAPDVAKVTPVAGVAGVATEAVQVVGACTPEKNHCIRDETWFWFENAYPDSEAPSSPVYQKKDGRWFTYQGKRKLGGYLARTELATAENVKRKSVVIVWRPNDGEPTWPISEDVALTEDARWRVMVVDAVDAATGTFNIVNREDMRIKLANARRVVERKAPAPRQKGEPEDDQ